MLPKTFKFVPISQLEAQSILSEVVFLTDQPLIGLETLQPLQEEMEDYLQQLKLNPQSYDTEDAWLKVTNAYMLAIYRVMLRVGELLEKRSA